MSGRCWQDEPLEVRFSTRRELGAPLRLESRQNGATFCSVTSGSIRLQDSLSDRIQVGYVVNHERQRDVPFEMLRAKGRTYVQMRDLDGSLNSCLSVWQWLSAVGLSPTASALFPISCEE